MQKLFNQPLRNPQQSVGEQNLKKINNANYRYSKTVAICGVIHGPSDVEKISSNLRKIGEWFKTAVIILVEFDTDRSIVASWKTQSADMNIVSLGNLKNKLLTGTDRYAYARNIYLDEVMKMRRDFDLLISVDLDDTMSQEIDEFLFENCLSEENFPKWDAVFANQSYRYYDIWSLRNENVEEDCFEQLKNGKTRQDAIFIHQTHIPRNSGLIPVKSAFGGLGVYKIPSIDSNCRFYGTVKESGASIFEHVPLNLYLTGKGCKLFIDSGMVLLTPPSFSKYYV